MILGCDRCVVCERFTGKNVGRLWNRSATTTPDILRIHVHTGSFISLIWNQLMAVSDILQLAFALCFRGGLSRTENIKYCEKNVDKLRNRSATITPDISTGPIHVRNIPDICHGRHGHVRVNFFWPV